MKFHDNRTWFSYRGSGLSERPSSAQVIRHHGIPIGMLTEEALEARHKECRLYRLSNTRKMSREETLLDLFIMLFVSSDPVVTSARGFEREKRTNRVSDPELDDLLISRPDDAQDSMAVLPLSSESESEDEPLDREFSDDGTSLELSAEEPGSN